MKILLVVPKNGYSFINQANYLSKGLTKIGVENLLIIAGSTLEADIKKISPDLLVGVGSWHDYKEFINIPQSLGIKCIPWIVSDDRVKEYVNEFNQLPLILTPSDYCRKVFERDGIKEGILKILPEAVDYDYWQPLSDSETKKFADFISITDPLNNLPFKFNLWELKEKGVPIIFTTGGDVTHKGALEVIKALGKINKEVGGKWIYLIKTWPYPFSFQYSIDELNLARKLGIAENIRYIVGEFSSDFLLNLINLCDIYAAPSRIEGFGLPFVEAALCEKPVVGLAETAVAEVIMDKETGFLVKSLPYGDWRIADINDLANTLLKLITDKNLRNTLGKKGREKAIQKFGPEVIAGKLMDLISNKESRVSDTYVTSTGLTLS